MHLENRNAVSGPWVDDLVRNLIVQISVHDEPMHGAWVCGHCPYMNVGPICTKCAGPRYDGKEIERVVLYKDAA